MRILKFGGTSVGSAKSISTVIDILKKEYEAGEKPVVVLSAMSGVTNLLSSMAENASRGEDFTAQLAELETRHFDMVRTLLAVQHQNPAYTKLKINFNHLEELLQGVLTLRELTPKTRDLVLSYGERCSTLMMRKMAAQYFPEALFVDASELIKTDSDFGHAKVNMELSEILIQGFYGENKGKMLFVTGFIHQSDP